MGQEDSNHRVTTRPIVPPYEEHPTLSTSNPRIFLRPFHTKDLEKLHELRSQIEVMKWTSTGKVDADIQATRTWMRRFMQVEDDLSHATKEDVHDKVKSASASAATFNFVIVRREDDLDKEAVAAALSAKVIGAGGCHVLNPQPECGYMIRKEYWGQGIATAVLKAVLEAYWKLERKTIQVQNEEAVLNANKAPSSKSEGGQDIVEIREQLKATIEATNIGSRRVLEKCNFQYHSNEVIPENGTEVELAHYYLSRP